MEDGRSAGGGEAGELAQGVVEGGERHVFRDPAARAVGAQQLLGERGDGEPDLEGQRSAAVAHPFSVALPAGSSV